MHAFVIVTRVEYTGFRH